MHNSMRVMSNENASNLYFTIQLALSIPKTNFILFHSKLKPNQSLRITIDDAPTY